ncbi:hypothetical protein C8J57DRAFT_1469745 [Mycena rebaudengoi]|nr:hypothetical protein C8J57DRAFT_1469745 [Mycena rebaudengoi]
MAVSVNATRTALRSTRRHHGISRPQGTHNTSDAVSLMPDAASRASSRLGARARTGGAIFHSSFPSTHSTDVPVPNGLRESSSSSTIHPRRALSQVHGANADSTPPIPPRRRTGTISQSVASIVGRPLNPHPDYQQFPEPSEAPSVHRLLRKSTIQTSSLTARGRHRTERSTAHLNRAHSLPGPCAVAPIPRQMVTDRSRMH